MLRDLSGQKKIDPQIVIAAIQALQAKGWDVNPNSVADEARIPRSALYRNAELMELILNAKAGGAGGSPEGGELSARVAELEERIRELEEQVRSLQAEKELLIEERELTWRAGYEAGYEEAESRQVATAYGARDNQPVDDRFYGAPEPGAVASFQDLLPKQAGRGGGDDAPDYALAGNGPDADIEAKRHAMSGSADLEAAEPVGPGAAEHESYEPEPAYASASEDDRQVASTILEEPEYDWESADAYEAVEPAAADVDDDAMARRDSYVEAASASYAGADAIENAEWLAGEGDDKDRLWDKQAAGDVMPDGEPGFSEDGEAPADAYAGTMDYGAGYTYSDLEQATQDYESAVEGAEGGEGAEEAAVPINEDELRDLLKSRLNRKVEEQSSQEQAKGLAGSRFIGGKRPTEEVPKPPQQYVVRNVPPEIRKACLVLGLRPEELTREAVHKAWKKEMANPGTHPDVGGDTEIAIYLNTARDALYRWLDQQAPKLGKKFGSAAKEAARAAESKAAEAKGAEAKSAEDPKSDNPPK